MTASAPAVSPELAELASAMDGRADTYGLLARVEVDGPLLTQLRSMTFPENTGNAHVDTGYELMHRYLTSVWEPPPVLTQKISARSRASAASLLRLPPKRTRKPCRPRGFCMSFCRWRATPPHFLRDGWISICTRITGSAAPAA